MRRFTLLLAFLLLVLTAPGWGGVQEEYRFAPGDVIEATVVPQRSFDRIVTVQPDGMISYPLVGTIQAAGLTAGELAEQLRRGLDQELLEPRVTVSLKERGRAEAARVSLLGAVHRPGAYEIASSTTLTEVVAAAGGPTALADLSRVTVSRADRSVLTLDLTQVEKTGRLERDILLLPGDFVVVPEGPVPSVLVLGELSRPGAYTISRGARLLDAITMAGGPTAQAELRSVRLIGRGGTQPQVVDVRALLSGAVGPEGNPVIQPGDTILVPETRERVYVLGRVTRPDVYPVGPKDRVLDLLARAGGADAGGDLARAVLIRPDEKGQPFTHPLDLNQIAGRGGGSANLELRAGDTLFIPDKRVRRSPVDFLFPLSALFTVLGVGR